MKPIKKPPKKRSSRLSFVGTLALLNEKVDVEKLLTGINFSEDDLLQAAKDQPSLFWEAGRYRVQRAHRTTMLAGKLKLAQSLAGQKYRRVRTASGKQEYTEGGVKERVELHPRVRKLQRLYNQAVAAEELSKLLLDVYKMRKDSLRLVMDSGKISVHSQELEMFRGSKKMRNAVLNIREQWNKLDL